MCVQVYNNNNYNNNNNKVVNVTLTNYIKNKHNEYYVICFNVKKYKIKFFGINSHFEK